MIPEQRSEPSDATKFATTSAQRAAEERNDHIGQAAAEIVAGHLQEAAERMILGMWKQWGVDRHSDANPAAVWAEYCERLDRYGGAA